MRRSPVFTIAIALTVLVARGGATGVAGTRVVRAGAASCAAQTRSQEYAHARLVVLANALQGPTAGPGARAVLLSPARMRVVRYVKGHGPRVIKVATAVTTRGSAVIESEDAIMPVAGERWKLYLTGRHQPYDTSVCAGSHRARTVRG